MGPGGDGVAARAGPGGVGIAGRGRWGGGPGGGWWAGGGPGWYGPVGRIYCTARKGVRVCGVKNALRTAGDRKSWRKMGEVGENTHGLEKNAKMLEKINTIIRIFPPIYRIFIRRNRGEKLDTSRHMITKSWINTGKGGLEKNDGRGWRKTGCS